MSTTTASKPNVVIAKPRYYDNGMIAASVKKDGEPRNDSATFYTNSHFGNDNGQFKPGSSDYLDSGSSPRAELRGSHLILTASLQNNEGEWDEASIDLTPYFRIENGQFIFVRPSSG